MTDAQTNDLLARLIRVGFVADRQPDTMRVRVEVRDTETSKLVTHTLPVLCPRACKDMQYDLPDVGDQVLCLFLPHGHEQGFVLGAMYGKQSPPVQSGDKWHRIFADGTVLEYDRQAHKLTASVQGDVDVTTAGSVAIKNSGAHDQQTDGGVTIKTPTFALGGSSGGTQASVTGTVVVKDGDVIADGVSLKNHVHVCPHCGTTDKPVR